MHYRGNNVCVVFVLSTIAMIKLQGAAVKFCDALMQLSYIILVVQNIYFATYRSLFILSVALAAYVRTQVAQQAGVNEQRPAVMTVFPTHHEQLMAPRLTIKLVGISFLYLLVPVIRLVAVNEDCWFFPFTVYSSFGIFMYPLHNVKRFVACAQIFFTCVIYCYLYLLNKQITLYLLMINLFWPFLLVFGIVFILQSYSALAIEKMKETNDALEQSNKTKSEFLSMLGHEIRVSVFLYYTRVDTIECYCWKF